MDFFVFLGYACLGKMMEVVQVDFFVFLGRDCGGK